MGKYKKKKIGFGQAMSDFSHYTVAKNRKVIVRFLPLVRPLFHWNKILKTLNLAFDANRIA